MIEIKKVLNNYSTIVTCQCFPKIFQTNNLLLKIIWTILFILFSVTTSGLVIQIIFEYFEYQVVSKIKIVSERPTNFPAITICDANPLSTEEAESLIRNVTLEEYGIDIDSLSYKDFSTISSNLIELLRMRMFSLSTTQKKSLGFSRDQIWKCTYDKVNCTSDDLKWIYNYRWGNCYQFNGNNIIKKAKSEHFEHGLTLKLTLSNSNKYPLLVSKGFRVHIHNQSFGPMFSEVINVRTGLETTITIRKTFSYSTPQPYSPCVDLDSFNSDLYRAIVVDSNRTYRQNDCLNLCLQRIIISKCKCFHPRFDKLKSYVKPCQSLSDLECINKRDEEFSDAKVFEGCLNDCPLECVKETFDLQDSSLDAPVEENFEFTKSDVYMKELEKVLDLNLSTFEAYKKHYVAINIFYPYLQYTEITEFPKTTIIELISNVGGSMGVILGFTLFSLIELVEVICAIILQLGFRAKAKMENCHRIYI